MRSNFRILLLLSPVICWLLFFFLLPLTYVIIYSFLERDSYGGIQWTFTLENYIRSIDGLYLQVLLRSITTGFICTVITLIIGYPFAYYLAVFKPKYRNLLLLLIVIPFWINFLIRTYAWILILRREGILNNVLTNLIPGIQPLELLNTPIAVQIGLVYTYLPFMILPLYASLEQIDLLLIDAAKDLGATPRNTFWHITFPLSLPGILAGSMLVFIPTVGAFLTPDLLGGGKVSYIGNVIERQFKSALDYPFGSALSILLMCFVFLGIVIYFRTLKESNNLGY